MHFDPFFKKLYNTNMPQENLITIQNCRIENSRKTLVPVVNWTMQKGQVWLVIGPNGGGKADFFNALAGEAGLRFVPAEQNTFGKSIEIVSLEKAARIIQEERENDESDYIEGGVDIGRTARVFISENLPVAASELDTRPEIELTGIQKILDRGLKYLSTGEIRRTLLARALISGKKLLLLSDPFAGLDAQSRKILFDFVSKMSGDNNSLGSKSPTLILGMERWHEIPDSVTNVLEFTNKEISFCGTRAQYETLLEQRNSQSQESIASGKVQFSQLFEETTKETSVINDGLLRRCAPRNDETSIENLPLVQMTNVNVAWGDNHVLKDLSWTVNQGEHWLIRGPNGSGKTTLLELITGDNMQVYCNDVHLFGIKRGSGETIWDIKKQLGIVSYRLHVEYRMLGGTSLLNVIISGFRDSIGLYEAAKDTEIALAKKWLALGGFAGRESESFGNLSYGEQRAVLILRSAVKSPKLLILDEPCHGLDENFRTKILHLMELIGQGGTTTMLHVTHDPTEILPCEKHVLELLPGQEPMFRISASS